MVLAAAGAEQYECGTGTGQHGLPRLLLSLAKRDPLSLPLLLLILFSPFVCAQIVICVFVAGFAW